MTLEACYAAMEGNLAQAMMVLGNEERARRYLLRFLDDPTAKLLFAALREGRMDDALRAAHTLKGLCRVLGLSRLLESCQALTQCLREGGAYEALYAQALQDYETAARLIAALEERYVPA